MNISHEIMTPEEVTQAQEEAVEDILQQERVKINECLIKGKPYKPCSSATACRILKNELMKSGWTVDTDVKDHVWILSKTRATYHDK